MIEKIKETLKKGSDKKRSEHSPKFFKTGKGEYAEGDVFWGVPVPFQRTIASRYSSVISIEEVAVLLRNPVHECRLTALFILVLWFKTSKGNPALQKQVFKLYINNIDQVNNWDLVDSSAHYIVGAYLQDKDRKLLYDLAKSGILWRQRIAIIATLWYIKNEDFSDCFAISELLLHHPHDLIHKAVGWMLREVGKINPEAELSFLASRYTRMPRTMLRYAIEKFPEPLRQQFLKGTF